MSKTLTDYVGIIMKEVDDNSAEAQNVITQAVKEVYQDIFRHVGRFIVSETNDDQTATVGLASYTPDDFTDLYGVHYKKAGDSNFYELKEITKKDYLDNHINDANSTPRYWYQNGLKVNLVPAPDDAGTIRFTLQPATAELTDTSLIPDRFTDVVKNGGCYKYYAYDNNPTALEYEKYYFRGLGDMENELGTKSPQIRPKLY